MQKSVSPRARLAFTTESPVAKGLQQVFVGRESERMSAWELGCFLPECSRAVLEVLLQHSNPEPAGKCSASPPTPVLPRGAERVRGVWGKGSCAG